MIQAQRAWVGLRNVTFSAELALDKPVDITIFYENTGHQPGTGFIATAEAFIASANEDGETGMKIQGYLNFCQERTDWRGGSIIYPGGGNGSSYNFNFKTDEKFVTSSLLKGDNVIVVHGCFVYRTFDQPKHSYFCYFFKQGLTRPSSLNICAAGHYAD